jgi:hypothetical protein
MKIPSLFKQYIWLIETINRAGKITLAEINEQWRMTEESGGLPLSRTTFNRHRDAILDMFGVIIDCDRKDGNRYFICNKEVLEDNSVQNWMFSTLSVSNMLDDNVSLQHRILLESIPSSSPHLQQIIKAMRESRRVMITYRKYGAPTANSFSMAPYCIKLFRRRWYVLGRMERKAAPEEKGKVTDGYLATFSLDRIEHLEIQETKFTMDPDFDAAAYFDQCFGIVITNDSKPVRIVLRAYGLEPYYLRDLPLHHSQKQIVKTEDYTDFEFMMYPTSDFKAHLLSRGQWLQVISPDWLAEEMVEWIQAALNKYKNEEIKK